MVKRRLQVTLAALLVSGAMFAQSQVSGTVIDENGEPVVGAAILVEGTKTGTVTDFDGQFSLSAPANSSLRVSYLGMQTKTVKAGQGLKISLLPDDQLLDEVMVVAYGTQKRSSFTGSAGEMKAEDISKHVVSSATQALTGSVAGVQTISSSGEPGSAPNIRIRGVGSYSASSEPLYIVDGAPYDGSISSINPADIAEMTVLKDAASAAIYGARGSNGVVIITTKKSRAAGAAKLTLDAKWGSNHRQVPRYDVITDPAQYYEMWFKAMYNSKYMHGSSATDAYNFATANLFNEANGGLGYQIYTVPEGENLIGRNFKLNPHATLGYSDGEYTYMPDDYYDIINKSSFRQEYNIGVSGSGDKLSYYGNLGFLSDGGTVEKSSFKRYTARSNVEYQAKKWLKFAANLDYSHTDSQTPAYDDTDFGSSGNVFEMCNTIAPIYPLYVRDAEGNIMTNEIGGPLYDKNQTNFVRPAIVGNAVGYNHYDSRDIDIDQFRGNWVVTVTPLDGLNLAANFTVFNRTANYNYLYSRYGSAQSDDGIVFLENDRTFTTNQIYTANYDKVFGRHSVNLLAGYEHYNLKETMLNASNDHLFDPFISELGNAYGKDNLSADSNTDRLVRDGYFFRGDYNYDQRYYGELSIRRDGSSIFAPGHRWGTFWSVSAGWQIQREEWFKAKWVNMLKLKASYGEQGNDNFGSGYYYSYHPWSNFYSITYNEETGEYTSQLTYQGNESLTWEKSGEWNFGFDFALFGNRLMGTFDYFHKKTHDLLYRKSLPLSSGSQVSTYPANVGAMVNKGVELTVNGDIIRSKEFTWSANLNLTSIHTEMTELDPSISAEGLKGNSTILRVGGSRYEAYMLKYAGTDKDNGQPLFYQDIYKNSNGDYYVNADGSYMTETGVKEYIAKNGISDKYVTETVTTNDASSATRYDLGDILPDVYGGFGMNFAYSPTGIGSFDLGFQFSYQLGGRVYDGMYQRLMTLPTYAGNAFHKDVLKGWDATTNPNSNIPVLSTAAVDNGNLSQTACDRFLTSSDYLNLNNVTLGYSLPRNLAAKLALSNLRVYVAGENLFLVTARKGLDPRVTQGVGTFSSGASLIGGGGYAAMRSITAGVQLTF